MSAIHYRADIDGLRAVAVLAVILHHLSASLLPGGFVGVDVFFVISGFLISSQLYAELRAGRFSLRQFYKRRINRLIPALLVVLSATFVAGLFILSPSDLNQLATSAAYAMTGLANLFFWLEYSNYFAGNAAEAPLLHTWSLAIEEQFYFIWPIALLLLFKLGSQRVYRTLLILGVLAALVVSIIIAGRFASIGYYLLPARFFELMIGGALAIFVADHAGAPRLIKYLSLTLGLTLIGLSMFLLDKDSVFPGLNALWPCLGAALVIYSGVGGAPRSVLVARPFVFVGLISYSLYLWHWPIIAYLNYIGVSLSLVSGALVVAASIVLAWASWKYVEVPMRKTGVSLGFGTVAVRRYLAPLAVTFVVGSTIYYGEGFAGRFDKSVMDYDWAVNQKPNEMRSGCHVPSALYSSAVLNTCRLGADKPGADGILIGDSFANHFTGMLDVLAENSGVSLIDYTMDGCPPILDYAPPGMGVRGDHCHKRNQAAYEHIRQAGYSRVVLAARWPRSEEAGEKMVSSIDAILATGAEVTLVMANQSIPRGSSCPIRNLMFGFGENCAVPQRISEPPYFAAIRQRYPTVKIIDPNAVICRDGDCDPVFRETPLYRDDGHLNDVGSRLIGRELLERGVEL